MYSKVICLSDILKASGYHTEFLNGGTADFAGIGAYLDSHNFSKRSGLEDYEHLVGDYRAQFGLYDDDLFDIATDRIRELANSEQPYSLVIQTITGHSAVGFTTKTCRENLKQGTLTEMQFAIWCSGYHIEKFLAQLEQEGLLENTLVLVQSDHFLMDNEHSDELNSKKRANFFSLSGPDIEPIIIEREAASFDAYPTILEVLGMPLDKGRAGLGVSLLSDEKTLVEIYGVDQLSSIVAKDRLLGELLWDGYQSAAELSSEKIAHN